MNKILLLGNLKNLRDLKNFLFPVHFSLKEKRTKEKRSFGRQKNQNQSTRSRFLLKGLNTLKSLRDLKTLNSNFVSGKRRIDVLKRRLYGVICPLDKLFRPLSEKNSPLRDKKRPLFHIKGILLENLRAYPYGQQGHTLTSIKGIPLHQLRAYPYYNKEGVFFHAKGVLRHLAGVFCQKEDCSAEKEGILKSLRDLLNFKNFLFNVRFSLKEKRTKEKRSFYRKKNQNQSTRSIFFLRDFGTLKSLRDLKTLNRPSNLRSLTVLSPLRVLNVLIVLLLFAMGSNINAQGNYLNEYINIAIENSPEIKANQNKILSAQEDIKAKNNLQDMEFGLNILPEPMMNVNGEQVATVSLMQMFPFPGTLKEQKLQMQCMTGGLTHKMRKIRADLIYKVKVAYWDMVLLNEEIKVTLKKITFAENYLQNAYQKYTSQSPNSKQKSTVPEIVNLQLKIQELELKVLTLKDELQTMKTSFNVLLHRDEKSEVVISEGVTKEEFDVSALEFGDIEKSSPELTMRQAEQQAVMHMVNSEKKMSLPMFGIGLEYMINKETSMPKMEDMNGKNMFAIMFKASLPLNRRKYSSNIASAKYKSESAAMEYELMRDNLRKEFLELKQKYSNLSKQLDLYAKQTALIEQNIQIIKVSYANNQVSVTDLINTEEKLLDYEFKKAVAITQMNKTIAKLLTMIDNYEEN